MFFDDDFPRGGWRIERPGAQEGGDGATLGAGFAANRARFRRRDFEGEGGHDQYVMTPAAAVKTCERGRRTGRRRGP